MGNMGKQTKSNESQQMTLSDFYRHSSQNNNLLYQSTLSSSGKDKKLIKKSYTYNESSEPIIAYLNKFTFSQNRLQYLGEYIQSENLLLPIYCYVKEEGMMCDQTKQLEIYLEMYGINIKEEILARKKEFIRFSQAEVWYLLYSIVNAVRKFQPFKMKSGNIKTSHILLNQKGHLKIINQLSEPEEKSSLLPNFYAPEEMRKLRDQRNRTLANGNINPNVAQTFSIAVIILEICTFIDGQSFYDLQKLQMNEQNIHRAESTLEKLNFSRLLQNLLRIMMANPQDRPLPSQIHLAFKPYEKRILNLEPFKFNVNKFNEVMQNSKASITSI